MNELDRDIRNVCEKMLRDCPELILNDVNERTIAGELARRLQGIFEDWSVDSEYNRIRDQVKRLHCLIDPKSQREGVTPKEERHGVLIVPDIIVHRRDTEENLLAVELKKAWSKGDAEWDKIKLQCLRQELMYRYSAFIEFGKEDARPIITDFEVHEGGGK